MSCLDASIDLSCKATMSSINTTIRESSEDLSVLPEELLLQVSSFGVIHPNLSPSYIYDEINSIDPNFPWQSELILEQLRSENELYQKHRRLLDLIPHAYCIDILLWDSDRSMRYLGDGEARVGGFTREDQDRIMESERSLHIPTDPRRRLYCVDESPPEITRALEIPVNIGLNPESIEDLGYTVIHDGRYLVVPLGDNILRSELTQMLRLAYPRTNTHVNEGTVRLVPDADTGDQSDIASIPETNEALSRDECIEVIKDIIRISTVDGVMSWKIGELIAWLKQRKQNLDEINDPSSTVHALNDLVLKHSIEAVTFYPHNLFIHTTWIPRPDELSDEDEDDELTDEDEDDGSYEYIDSLEGTVRAREIAQYLRSQGLEGVEAYDDQITVHIQDDEDLQICQRIFQDALKIRMTRLRFSPVMEDVYECDI